MAADCNCSNPSCPCYKGKQDKTGERQAPNPHNLAATNGYRATGDQNGVGMTTGENSKYLHPPCPNCGASTCKCQTYCPQCCTSPCSCRPRSIGAASRATAGSNGTNGGTMTAPGDNGNSGGGDIMSVQDMRNHWQQAGTTAAGATDPLNSAASQLKELAARMEAVQAHAAQHGDETASQAAAAAETYRALAQKCDEAAAAVEPAIAGCAAAEQGLERFRPTEEALSSLPNRHEQTAAYVGS